MRGKGRYGKRSKKVYNRRRKFVKRFGKLGRYYHGNGNKVTSLTFGGQLIPDRAFTKLKYSELTAVVTMNTGATANQVYRLNSPYDPFNPTGGKSAMGFTQMASLYNYYRCYGSKITWKISNTGSTQATSNIMCVLYPSVTSTPQSSIDDLMSQPYSKNKIYAGQSSGVITLSDYKSVSKILGVSKEVVRTDDTYRALVTADPALDAYWVLSTKPVDGSSSTTAQYWVTIEYLCEFYGRKDFTEASL